MPRWATLPTERGQQGPPQSILTLLHWLSKERLCIRSSWLSISSGHLCTSASGDQSQQPSISSRLAALLAISPIFGVKSIPHVGGCLRPILAGLALLRTSA